MTDKTAHDDSDLEFPIPVTKFRKVTSNLYEFYLSGPIKDPSNYIEWFDIIRNAGSNDTIRIYINSQGGMIDTALQFMRVLSETDAFVVASVEGSCMSAATMVFLAADTFEVTDHCLFMFHNYSGGMFGKGGEIYDQAIFERKWSSKFLHSIYEGFLTKEEIESLLDNKDLWLDSEDIAERCTKLIEYREAAVAALQEEEQDDDDTVEVKGGNIV